MKTFTQENSVTSTPKYDKKNDEYQTIYSKRGISADVEALKVVPIHELYKTIWSQDDFGLVTIYTNLKDFAIKFVVEHSNLGYNIRAWENGRPCYELEGMLQGADSLGTLFNKFDI